MSFGEKLTKLRKEKGMSQEELANYLNVSRQAVSKWESNNSYPETDKIIALCKLFNVSMDELIGIKNGSKIKGNKPINILNEYFDRFITGIKMFYNMSFGQKIKCLVEMMFYVLILIIFFVILRVILIEVISKILNIIPYQLLNIIIQIFEGLFYLVYLCFMIYVLVKLYKVRYLDYYEAYLKDNKKEIIVEKENENNKNIIVKEEKIIIRDSNNEFKLLSWLKKCCMFFIKAIAVFTTISLLIIFVLSFAIIIFTIYFISYGMLILYILLFIMGFILVLYVFIEMLIKFIFNIRQSFKKLFIMFISSVIIIGISCGLFVSELTTYKIIQNPIYDNLVYEEELEMEDNLIINFLRHNYDVEVIIEKRDNIKIEYYGTDKNISPITTSIEKEVCNRSENLYPIDLKEYDIYLYHNYYDYFNGTFNEYFSYFLDAIKNKEIINDSILFDVKVKIYLSDTNYQKIINNINDYNNLFNYGYNCYYE